MVFAAENITDNFNAATYHLPILPPPDDQDPNKPNNVIFSFYDGTKEKMWRGAVSSIKWNLADPVVYELASCGEGQDAMDCIIGTLREHVRDHGTIDELDILGHGTSLSIESEGGVDIDIEKLLPAINQLEVELGMKVCHRLVFQGCNTFSDLDDAQVSNLRQYADENDMDIVGTTSVLSSFLRGRVNDLVGRYVQFTRDGDVIRDPLDDRFAPLAWFDGKKGRKWVKHEIARNEEYQENKNEALATNTTPKTVEESDGITQDSQGEKYIASKTTAPF